MEASRVICTNCIVIVVPKTFKELISIVLEVRSIVLMICRFECFIGGSYNISIKALKQPSNPCSHPHRHLTFTHLIFVLIQFLNAEARENTLK